MTDLRILQKNFVNGVLSNNHNIMESELNTESISAEGLMGIYRNNTIGAISGALELTYPVIHKLVGEEFFAFTATKFLEKYKPKSGNLDDYGSEFGEFLKDFPPATNLLYLPDVAKLEWLFHLSSLADTAKTIDQSDFAKIPQEKYFDLYLQTHPSLYFMSSKYPVHLIWEMNQDGADQSDGLDLSDEGGVELMLIKKNMKVNIIAITKAESAFLKSLHENESFYEAYEAATREDEEFDLAFYVVKHIVNGVFSGCSLNN